jgi:Fe(3+) dicitrate transport protein
LRQFLLPPAQAGGATPAAIPPQGTEPPQGAPAPKAAPAAEPQESEQQLPATLETLVVTAERGVPLTYAGGRDVIEPETKEQYPDGNVSTLLRRVPGVTFQPENANDSRINVGLRGNDPRRSALTTVMVDGIPVCEAPYGNTDVDGMPIAMERVWRIDVIRGGGSVRYGPNSAGGIVNFLTEPVPEAGLLRLGGRVGSDGDYASSVSTGSTWGPFGVLVSGVWKGGDGYRENGEYEDLDGAIKARYALGPNETLSAYVSRFTEFHAEQPGGLPQAAYDEDPSQSLREGSDFSLAMDRYVLDYENRISRDSAFELKGWYQDGYRHLNDYRPVLQPFTVLRTQESEFSSGALEASYTWSAEYLGAKHTFHHLARYLTEQNDEFYYRQPLDGGPTVTPYDLHGEFEGRSFSMFNEDVIALNRELDWALGFRVEDLAMTGHSPDTGRDVAQDYSVFLPETSLTWNFRPLTAVYASYQQGFYPPQYETGFDPNSVLYAPTDPESSEAYEVGLRSREIEGLESSLALFDTEFHDKIDFINTPAGLKVPVNTGHARAYGVELSLHYDLGAALDGLEGLSVYGTLTEQRSMIESGQYEGNDTPNSPHTLASWGVQYDHLPTGLWARLGGSYTGDSYKDLANTEVGSADGVNGPVPAYTLWDAALGWYQRPDRTGFALSVGVTNLLDEEYFRRFSTGIYPGAPRQAFATVGYTLAF